MARRVVALEQPPSFGMRDKGEAKRIGDALRGDVVMGRADTAGRKDIVKAAPHFVDRGHNDVVVVRNDPRLAQPDPGFAQTLCEKCQIGILRAVRQDLVADDQDTGGDDLGCAVGRHSLLGISSGKAFIGNSWRRHNRWHPRGLPPNGAVTTSEWRRRDMRLLPDPAYRIITATAPFS